MKTEKINIGVIADDFTGAGDAASFLAKSGAKTIMYNTVPKQLPYPCDAIVIALKTRSIKAHEAISETKKAVDFFRQIGCEKIYFKYCSTFDSTPQGNIGIVTDFLLDYLQLPYTVLCPSLPVNNRIVKDGILYVNGTALHDSPLRNHPLNPMWDSYIPNLMKPQSRYPCFIMKQKDFCEWKYQLQELQSKYKKFYIIPDYESDEDGRRITQAFEELPLLTGGSGLLEYVVQHRPGICLENKNYQKQKNKTILLCGSCSEATRYQVEYYRKNHGICYPVDADSIMKNAVTAKDILAYADQHKQPVLIYSNAVEQDMKELKKKDTFHQASKLIEQIMGDISCAALNKGYNRIIVAGGETSGAVIQKLGVDGFYIGKSVDPGVPELIPLNNNHITLVLKSGNFGAEDFFAKAAGGCENE